jgi:hypothetical protein
MVERPFEREELETLFVGGGLTRGEVNHLLGERPGALSRQLTTEFISNVGALRHGDFHDVEVRGFVISAPSHFETIFLAARPRLERILGPVSLAVVSPSPTDATFALPAVVPRAVASARELRYARFARLETTVLNLEMLGGAPARFLLVNAFDALAFEDFFARRPPNLTGEDVLGLLQDRLNLDFSEVRLALLAHLFSAPPYHDRAGGTGLSLIACEDRNRCLSKRALHDVLRDLRLALPAYLTGRRSSSHLDYLGIRPVPLRFEPLRMHWKFNQDESRAAAFLRMRKPGDGTSEMSLSTGSVLEVHDFERDLREMMRKPSERQVVISVCDLPVLLTRDDLARDEAASELHRSSEDVAHAVVHSAMVNPHTVLEPRERSHLVERILREIHRDWPDLERCMKRQVVFNLSAQGGLIEHATRAAGAVVRARSVLPEDAMTEVQTMFVGLFARFYDALEPQLRHYVAVLEKQERQRVDRMEVHEADALESAFIELDATFPDGWPYPELERLVLPRVDIGRAGLAKRFERIRAEGEVVEVAPTIFKRVWGAELFR